MKLRAASVSIPTVKNPHDEVGKHRECDTTQGACVPHRSTHAHAQASTCRVTRGHKKVPFGAYIDS